MGLHTDPSVCLEQNMCPLLDILEILPLVFVLWVNLSKLPKEMTHTVSCAEWSDASPTILRSLPPSLGSTLSLHWGLHTDPLG